MTSRSESLVISVRERNNTFNL